MTDSNGNILTNNGSSFYVDYNRSEWRSFTQQRLDEIVSKGFDGVMFDTVSRYRTLANFTGGVTNIAGDNFTQDELFAAGNMRSFLISLSQKAKSRVSDFKILPNSGLGLAITSLDRESDPYESYFSHIDGVLKESVFYRFDDLRDNNDIEYNTVVLDHFVERDKPVFILDFPTTENNRCDFLDKIDNKSYIGYPTTDNDFNKIYSLPNC